MISQPKISLSAKILDLIAFLLLFAVTILWAVWGIGEVFHEGWYQPYWHIIFYFIPFIVIFGFAVLAIFYPLVGGILIFVGGLAYFVLFTIRAIQNHTTLEPSFFIMNIGILFTGLIFIFCYILNKKTGTVEYKWFLIKRYFPLKKISKVLIIVCISLVIIISIGSPMLIRNLNRIPLENFSEVKIEGNEITVTLSAEGPGWYYSNKSPLIFNEKEYSGLSWNEIALFGKEPIGFEGKNYGKNYNGTSESIYYATQQDFDKYNMFRYINFGGIQLTNKIQDYWRLPSIDEYVRLLKYRDKNAGGFFDSQEGQAYYYRTPDKDAPIWAPEEMVIYYWTSTSANDTESYDLTYSGEARKISKTTKQDYRGFRAIRSNKTSSDLIKMEVENIMIDSISEMPVILLKESGGNRYLPIWIGISEAYSIAMALSEVETIRPMTHDLMLNTLGQLKVKVESIEISNIVFDTYFALINLRLPDGTLVKIDSRPSDAIALAVRLNCEIFAAREVLDSRGIEFKNKEDKAKQFKDVLQLPISLTADA
jgi:bifunctional DNase/RNase